MVSKKIVKARKFGFQGVAAGRRDLLLFGVAGNAV